VPAVGPAPETWVVDPEAAGRLERDEAPDGTFRYRADAHSDRARAAAIELQERAG